MIWLVLLELVISLLSMVFRVRIMLMKLSMLLKLFWKDLMIFFIGIFEVRLRKLVVMIRVMKGCILKWVISMIRLMMVIRVLRSR